MAQLAAVHPSRHSASPEPGKQIPLIRGQLVAHSCLSVRLGASSFRVLLPTLLAERKSSITERSGGENGRRRRSSTAAPGITAPGSVAPERCSFVRLSLGDGRRGGGSCCWLQLSALRTVLFEIGSRHWQQPMSRHAA